MDTFYYKKYINHLIHTGFISYQGIRIHMQARTWVQEPKKENESTMNNQSKTRPLS